jgi:hypothetical protein
MLAFVGGREHSLPELAAMAACAGLAVTGVHDTIGKAIVDTTAAGPAA